MAQWNENTVPKCDARNCSDEVLITVQHMGYLGKLYKMVIKAVYFPYHHCTVEDMGWNMCDGVPDDWEYIEEEDTWWIPQGWYEVCDYSPDDYSYFTITDKVIAWMKLTKPFNKKLKQLSEIELPKTPNPEVVKEGFLR